MAAPQYVPMPADRLDRGYQSPPRRPESWTADRPGELEGRQPTGDRLGTPGPDQGYALSLLRHFDAAVHLADGEHRADANAGALAVAMKRCALMGRGPIIHDLTVGFAVWGFLDASPATDLVELRGRLFAEIHHNVHYDARRTVADLVPDEVLTQPHAAILEAHAADWRSCLAV